MVAMKDFSRKWSVVKICPFTGHITLYGHTKCYKWLYTYFSGYIFTNFQHIKCINRLKMLRETIHTTIHDVTHVFLTLAEVKNVVRNLSKA